MAQVNNSAPVCNQPAEPVFPTPTVADLPPIPVATDLASALAAINAMRHAIMIMTNQIPRKPSTTGSGAGGNGGGSRPNNQHPQGLQDFAEVRKERVSSTVRVFNPDDKTQFVDVQQITGLVFQNNVGQKLRFSQ